MKLYDYEEQAVKNSYDRGYADGWNEAVEYIRTNYEKIVKKRGLDTDRQRLSKKTIKGENEND